MANIYSFTNQPVAFSNVITSSVSSGNNLTITNSSVISDTPISILQTSLNPSANTQIILGRANTAFNSAFINFNYLGLGSNTNKLTLGLNAQTGITIDGNNSLVIPGTITSSISGTATNLIITNAASASQIPVTIFQPNLTSGQSSQIHFGISAATNTSGVLKFNNVNGTATANTISLGLFGSANSLTLNNIGNLLITNSGTSGTNRSLLTLNTLETATGTGGSIDFAQNGTVFGKINSKYESAGNFGLYFSSYSGGALTERMSINSTGTLTVNADINYSGTTINTTGGLNTLVSGGSKGSFTIKLRGLGDTGKIFIYTDLDPSSWTGSPDGRLFAQWIASKNYNVCIRGVKSNGSVISFKITSLLSSISDGGSSGGNGTFSRTYYSAIPIATAITSNSWSVSGTTLTLTTVNSGFFRVGMILSGTGITANTIITSITTGYGGSGTVATVSISQTAGSTNTLTGTEPAARCTSWSVDDTTLTLSSVSFGYFYVGMIINATGISANTTIISIDSGNGGSGSEVTLSNTQTSAFSQTTLLTGATNVIDTYNFGSGDEDVTLYPIQDIKTGDLFVSNGSIGINTNTPNVALDVVGAGKFSSSLNALNLTLSGGQLNNTSYIIRNSSIDPKGIFIDTTIAGINTAVNIGYYMPKLSLGVGTPVFRVYNNIDDRNILFQVTSAGNNSNLNSVSINTKLTISDLITGSNGLTISSGTTSLQAVNISGISPAINLLTDNPGDIISKQYTGITGDRYGFGQYNNGILRAFFSHIFTSATFRISRPLDNLRTPSATFTDLVTVNYDGSVNITNFGTSGTNRPLLTLNTTETATGTGGSIDISQAGTIVSRINSKYESNGNFGLYFSTFTSSTLTERMSINSTGTVNISNLTANCAVATDASKNLISVINTGSGNNVLATNPTISGGISFANLSGSINSFITVNGTLGPTTDLAMDISNFPGTGPSYRMRVIDNNFSSNIKFQTRITGASTNSLQDHLTLNSSTSGAQSVSITGGLNVSNLTASSAVATDASKNLVSVTNTGSGNNVLATGPTLTDPIISGSGNRGIYFGSDTLVVINRAGNDLFIRSLTGTINFITDFGLVARMTNTLFEIETPVSAPQKMQSGSRSTPATGSYGITFPVTFINAPIVVISIDDSGVGASTVTQNITTTGFTIVVGGSPSVNCSVKWIAMTS